LLSGHVQTSLPDDQRYQKSWWDLLFLAYYIIFFAFVRQSVIIYMAKPLAQYFGVRRPSKVVRFGEQTYALFYFAVFGAWGYVRPLLSFHAPLMSTSVSCQVFQRTGTILSNSGKASTMYSSLLTFNYTLCRLPSLGHRCGTEVLLSPAIFSLAPGITRCLLWFRKGKKRQSRTCCSSLRHIVAYRVRPILLSTAASDIRQVELFRKYDIYWQCCLHEHGYTRLISSCKLS